MLFLNRKNNLTKHVFTDRCINYKYTCKNCMRVLLYVSFMVLFATWIFFLFHFDAVLTDQVTLFQFMTLVFTLVMTLVSHLFFILLRCYLNLSNLYLKQTVFRLIIQLLTNYLSIIYTFIKKEQEFLKQRLFLFSIFFFFTCAIKENMNIIFLPLFTNKNILS